MTLTVVPAAAAIAATLAFVFLAGQTTRLRHAWWLPAALSLAYLLFTLRAVGAAGPLGFWAEHTRNLWGNQIWLDLLLSMTTGFSFAIPHARRFGMRPWPWVALILGTGSIGYLAFAARILYLRERRGETVVS